MRKYFSRHFRLVTATSLFVTLAGCAGHIRVPIGEILTLGLSPLPSDMQYTNMYAVIHPDAFSSKTNVDEAYFWNHSLLGRAALHAGGITLGKPNELFRVVPASVTNTGSPHMYWSTAFFVPDQIPKLHAYDAVEVRMRGTYDGGLDFSGVEDAPVVLRLVCAAGDSNYIACVEALPANPRYPMKHTQPSGTPYAKHWNEHGFTFTPRYLPDGTVRTDAKPLPARTVPISADYNEHVVQLRHLAEENKAAAFAKKKE